MANSFKSSKPNQRCDSTEPGQARAIPAHHCAVFSRPDDEVGGCADQAPFPLAIKHPLYTAKAVPNPVMHRFIIHTATAGRSVGEGVN